MTEKAINYLMAIVHVKQAKIYLEFLLENYNIGLSGKAKSKWLGTVNSLKTTDDFFETGADEQEKLTAYELSASISNINRYLIMFPDKAQDVENYLETCLKQEKRL